jgi:stalled ribosome rescue protein Dom34
MKGGYRRGYPVAILVGLKPESAVLWRVYSNVVKFEKTILNLGGRNDAKAWYNFYELVICALRPMLKEGVRGLIVVSPVRTDYGQKLAEHIAEHHMWLVQGQNRIALSFLTGSAGTLSEVTALSRTDAFKKQVSDTVTEETENLLPILEKRLSESMQKALVLYSLEDIEGLILFSRSTGALKPEYLFLTDSYLARSRQKGRIHRLMQIAINRKIKTRIVEAKSNVGVRVEQLGGIVCLALPA